MPGENEEESFVDPLAMFSQDFVIEKDENEDVTKEEEVGKKKEQPAPKKAKEESIVDLRKARDAIQKEKDILEAELKLLRGTKPLKKVADYLKTKYKKEEISDEDVDDFIKRNQERKKKLGELENTVKTKDQALKELSIEHSEEWQTEFVAPIKKSANNIFTLLANQYEDADGKVKTREEEMVKSFMNQLVAVDKDGNTKQPIEIKAALAKFKKAYEEKTGLDYEAPSLKEVIQAVEDIHIKIAKADKAKSNWNEELEERNKVKIYEDAEKEKARLKKELDGRDYIVSKLKESDELKDIKDIFGEDEDVNVFIDKEHEFLQSGLRKDKDFKPKGYGPLVIALAKSEMFDKLKAKYTALKNEFIVLKKHRDSGLPPPKGKRSGSEEESKPGEINKDNVLSMFSN